MNEETARASAEASNTPRTARRGEGWRDGDFVVTKFGRINYAVNAAGVNRQRSSHLDIAETDLDNFDNIMRINTRGMLLCCRAQTAAMRKQEPQTFTSRNGSRGIGRGAIVNVASANSFAGLPGKGSYTSSKHACMGLDHAPEGIRCNAVFPVWVRTPLLDVELQRNPEVGVMISAMVPIKRAAESEEVGDTITYLLSPSASYINGTSVILDAALTTTVRLF
ncbi:hypothetical protein BDW69DRAFT_195303 [Aspergillus filifer]